MNQQIYVECIKMQKEQMDMIGNQVFIEWRKSGFCRVQADQQYAGQFRIEFEGNVAEKRENVKTILNKMEEKLQGHINFAIILEIILPENLCGYVVGKGGNTIINFNKKFNVHTEFDKEKENIPDGFSRLKMKGFRVAYVRNGYFDLLRMAELATNSAEGKGKTMNTKAFQQKEEPFQNKVKIPAFHKLTAEQRETFYGIGEAFGLNNITKETSFLGDHFLVLNGNDSLKVLAASRKMREFVKEIEQQNGESKIVKMAEQISIKQHSNNSPVKNGRLVLAPKSPVKNAKIKLVVAPVKKNLVSSKSPVKILTEPIPLKRLMVKELKEKKMTTVPQCIVPCILGPNGVEIKQLQKKFGVKMNFLGENHLDYPDGRTLEIHAESNEKIKTVVDYIEKEFIVKINKKYYKQNQISLPSEWDRKVVVPYEMTIRIDIEEWMAAMKKRTGIAKYVYVSNISSDKNREILLKGSKASVDMAEKDLLAEANKFLINSRKSNDLSSQSDPPMDISPCSPPPTIPNYSESSAIIENKLEDDLISIFTINDFNPSMEANLAKMNNFSKHKSISGPIKKGNDFNASKLVKEQPPKQNELETTRCVKCKKRKRNIICHSCNYLFFCRNCIKPGEKCPKCGEKKISMVKFVKINEEVEE